MIYIFLPILLLLLGYLGKKHFEGGRFNWPDTLRLDRKIVFITGANSGIGKITAIELAKKGATIIMACRDIKKAQQVVGQIEKLGYKPFLLKLDLSDLEQVRECVKEFSKLGLAKIDILINNAGVMATLTRQLTKQGHEMQFGTNHLGHFLLTELLIPYLKKSESPRIVNVASIAHQFSNLDFTDLKCDRYATSPLWSFCYTYVAYANSKLSNILHAMEANKRYGIPTVSLHPGVVRTELMRNQLENSMVRITMKLISIFYAYFTKDSLQGCQTTFLCAVSPLNQLQGGGYYADCRLEKIKAQYTKDNQAERLWEVSKQLIEKYQ